MAEKRLLIVTLVLSFGVPFTSYLLTLAPTVTFEDSGELIAAAFNLGVPHQPGYPLFTLLAKVFTFLPFGTIAFRVNLMSAFFSSLGVMFLAWTFVLILRDVFGDKTQSSLSTTDLILGHGAGVAVAIVAGLAFETWEQSVITEVYGLNTMFLGLLLLLAVGRHRQNNIQGKESWFLRFCFVFGLCLTNHPSALLLIPALAVFVVISNRMFVLNPTRLAKGMGFFVLGLTPYLYLPIASLRNPVMDWGNPENLTNFLRTVSRHQYQYGASQTLGSFLGELSAYVDLALHQWVPLVLVLAVLGLFVMIRADRLYRWFFLVLLIVTGPLTTWFTDFDVTGVAAHVAVEHKALVSVFYIPSYGCIALLFGIGAFAACRALKPSIKAAWVLGFLMIGLAVGLCAKNFRKADMSRYRFAEHYAHNLFQITSDSALIFVDWDPFYFPLNYYQYVEDRRPDLTILDQMLLKRSWYIEMLRCHHPQVIKASSEKVDMFLKAVAPFEAGQEYDGNLIQARYEAMINSFMDQAKARGKDVYLTYTLNGNVAAGYFREPMLVAFRLTKEPDEITFVPEDSLRFDNFFDERVPLDRMAHVFKKYYGGLFFWRAYRMEKASRYQDAHRLYEKALLFLTHDSNAVRQIQQGLARIKTVRSVSEAPGTGKE